MNAHAPAAKPLARQIRRAQAWLYAVTTGRRAEGAALALVLLHVVIWTAMLAIQKSNQDLHSDVTEAFGWGQRFQLGYGKHPPLSG